MNRRDFFKNTSIATAALALPMPLIVSKAKKGNWEEEFDRCKDPVYFIEKYCVINNHHIVLSDAQRFLVRCYHSDLEYVCVGSRHAYGKSTIACCLLLWESIFSKAGSTKELQVPGEYSYNVFLIGDQSELGQKLNLIYRNLPPFLLREVNPYKIGIVSIEKLPELVESQFFKLDVHKVIVDDPFGPPGITPVLLSGIGDKLSDIDKKVLVFRSYVVGATKDTFKRSGVAFAYRKYHRWIYPEDRISFKKVGV